MKKIVILIVWLLCSFKVEAYETGVWTDELVNDSNVIVKNEELRYKWYKSNLVYSSDYYIEGDNDTLYPYIEKNDYIETDYGNWQDMRPDDKPNRIIESKNTGRYRTLRPIRYLFLENFTGGHLVFNISELDVLINNVEIKVNMNCNNCSSNFIANVNDNYYDNKAYINNGGSLTIDLGNYYGIEQIKLALYMYDSVPNTKKFDLYFNEGNSVNDQNYAHKEITSYVVSKDPLKPEKYLIIPDKSFITNAVFNDWVYIEGCVNATYYREMQFLNIYRYKDIKHRYYKEERSYLDGYYAHVENQLYIKDESNYKEFYIYDYVNKIEENSKSDVNVEFVVSKRKIEVAANTDERIENKPVDDMMEEDNKLVASKDDIKPPKHVSVKKTKTYHDRDYKMIYACSAIGVLFLLGLIFKIRNQILSHQK